MNFLLHRHLAFRDLGSETAAAGAMLPDLWRMADRRVRARPGLGPDHAEPLLRGIEHHLDLDRRFHRHPLFTEGEARTAGLFRRAGLARDKLLLFAHPAWELCLDGALIHHQGLDTVLASLGRAEAHLTSESAAAAADLHHFEATDRGAAERLAFGRRMATLARDLARGDWVAGYTRGDGLARRLGGIRLRLGLPPLAASLELRLADVLAQVLKTAEQDLLAAGLL